MNGGKSAAVAASGTVVAVDNKGRRGCLPKVNGDRSADPSSGMSDKERSCIERAELLSKSISTLQPQVVLECTLTHAG